MNEQKYVLEPICYMTTNKEDDVLKNRKSTEGFKAVKNRVTFLLCSNTSGDKMLKPLLVNKNLRIVYNIFE